MRRDGEEKPGVVTVKVEDLKVIYKEPLPSRIDTAFAASGQILKTLHIPIIIDRDNYIVDGHHRYYRHKLDGKKEIKAVKLSLTFGETEQWRTADRMIKGFSRRLNNPALYRGFKHLVQLL